MTSITRENSDSNLEAMSDYEIARGLRHTGTPKRANEKWYVINQKWFNRAKKTYVDAVDSGIGISTLSINDDTDDDNVISNNNSDDVVLEPIDNADLFHEPTTYKLPIKGDGTLTVWRGLKPTLIENHNFELLPEKIFKELVRRHGILDETHYLERYTIEKPSRSMYLPPDIKIDIYPIPCTIYKCNPENGECCDDDTVSTIFMSPQDDLKLVTSKAKEKIDTRAALKVRLWYRQKKNKNSNCDPSGWRQVTDTDTVRQMCEHVRTGENPFPDADDNDDSGRTPDAPDEEDEDLLYGGKRSDALPCKIAYELMMECKDKDGCWARGPKDSKKIITDLKSWRLGLKVGDRCDAMDSVAGANSNYTPQWFEGIVQEINEEKNTLLIHFHAWKPRFDEWITRDSERLQPRFTKKRDWRSQLKVNERVELNVYNKHKKQDEWIAGLVLKIDRTVEGSEKIFVKELNKGRSTYSNYYSSSIRTYSNSTTRWISVWDEKLTEQHTHIKDEKKIEGDGRSTDPGVVGLRNLGNTCYMNSMLQCLSNTTLLTEFFLSKEYVKDINRVNVNSNGGRLAEAYGDLMEAMWSGNDKVVKPQAMKAEMGRICTQFSGYQQQDSQEFLIYLLDNLHEDLNRIKNPPYVEDYDGNGEPDEMIAIEQWKRFRKRNESHLTDTMYGQLRSRLTDPFTNQTSVKFEAFSSFAVPIPIPTQKKLECVFFPLKAGPLGACMIEVDVPRNMPCGEDMAKSVSAITGIPKENLFVEEIYRGKVWQQYYNPGMKSRKSFSGTTLEQDHFCVYEVPPFDKLMTVNDVLDYNDGPISHDVDILLQVRWAAKSSSQRTYTSDSYIGNPMLLNINTSTTAADIHALMRQYIEKALPGYCSDGNGKNDEKTVSNAIDESNDIDGSKNEDKTDGNLPADNVLSPSYTESWKLEYEIEIETSKQRALPDETEINFLEECAFLKSSRGSQFNNSDNSPKILVRLSKRLIGQLERLLCDPDKYDKYRPPQHESQRSDATDSSGRTKRLTLQSCLEKFTTKERLGENDEWYSPFSKKHVRAFKEMSIWSLPDILIIQLKRFLYEASAMSQRYGMGNRREKVTSLVHFPIEGLDMKPYVLGPCEESEAIYDLYAVSNHMGGMGGGHYTAYGLNSRNGKWYEFDDTRTSEVNAQDVITAKAYVLFYCRRSVMERINKQRIEIAEQG